MVQVRHLSLAKTRRYRWSVAVEVGGVEHCQEHRQASQTQDFAAVGARWLVQGAAAVVVDLLAPDSNAQYILHR